MTKTAACKISIKAINKMVNLIMRQGAKIARSRNTSTITSKRTAMMMEMNLWETRTMWPRRMQTIATRKSMSARVDMPRIKEEKGAEEADLNKMHIKVEATKDKELVI